MVGNKYYAIGFGYWVELRVATTPPKAIKTEAKVEGKERLLGYTASGNTRWQTKKVPVTISYTVHEGGKVLGAIQTTVCKQLIGNAPAQGAMVTLTKAQLEKLANHKKSIKLA